jgi:exoribonuclease R
MARGETLANRVDNAVIDLAESVLLSGREGDVFDAVVVDEDGRGTVVQLVDPAVMVRVAARRVDPGDEIRIKLTAVDAAARTVTFERVG